MSGFLYFCAGRNSVSPEQVRELGLAYAFGADAPETREVNTSPSGKAGVIFCDSKRQGGKAAGYYPGDQTWRKMPVREGKPEVWVGYWNDAKPGPDDLQREKILRGLSLELGDGQRWTVPIVRSFDGAAQEWKSELPAAWVAGANGSLVPGKTPRAQYQYLWDLTAPIADAMFAVIGGEEGAQPPSDESVGKAVVALLATNYLVGASEIELLEMIGSEEAAEIIAVATRYDTLLDWADQKKTQPRSVVSIANSSSGAAA